MTMIMNDADTLSKAVNKLTKSGFTENFMAEQTKIKGMTSKKEFLPEELEIAETFRFDGMTNPQDDSAVYAIVAYDGTKGTLVMSHSAEHNQNVELIKAIRKQ